MLQIKNHLGTSYWYMCKKCQGGAFGQIFGKFVHHPVYNFICSLMKLEPMQKSGQWRLIMHLNYP